LLQRRGDELRADAYIPYRVAFDVEKLTWELDFFVKYFIEGYRGAALAPQERAALSEEWSSIVTELAGERRVLCHRDYHSRNLMLHDGRLYIIDFQDARMGPDTYDLVSLLRDAYVDLPPSQVDEPWPTSGLTRGPSRRSTEDQREFRRRFDLMALQRNLKALGTFGYQTTARRNPVYIQYIPRTLRYARHNLQKGDRFARLRDLLTDHVDELR
jgi:aminoglycoside/choline kinase family phosphotransferase